MNATGGNLNQEAIQQRFAEIRGRIAAACQRAGRAPESVRLVAVSKTHPAEAVLAALETGQRLFGESRIQEAAAKIDAVAASAGSDPLEWHLIGHLQRNKVNAVIQESGPRFALIHSVDSARLAEALEARAAKCGVTQRILLEVNVGGEASKSGANEAELEALLSAVAQSPHLRAEGLMTIPPYVENPEDARPYFRQLRELMARLGPRPNFTPQVLSMGMSHDFEVAIEEGATLVRVGTALFGERFHPAP